MAQHRRKKVSRWLIGAAVVGVVAVAAAALRWWMGGEDED